MSSDDYCYNKDLSCKTGARCSDIRETCQPIALAGGTGCGCKRASCLNTIDCPSRCDGNVWKSSKCSVTLLPGPPPLPLPGGATKSMYSPPSSPGECVNLLEIDCSKLSPPKICKQKTVDLPYIGKKTIYTCDLG